MSTSSTRPAGPGPAPSRAPIVRAVLALAIVAGSLFFAVTESPTLGLDLRGGTQIVLQTQDGADVAADAESTARAVTVLERRVNALGVAESTIVQSGDVRIIVELPGLQDPREAAEVIGRTAQLTFRPVVSALPPDAEPPAELPAGQEVLTGEGGERLVVGPVGLTGEGVTGAEGQIEPPSPQWFVNVDFSGEGQQQWVALTGAAACNPVGDPSRRVAIVLDDDVISAPEVNPDIACNVGITGTTTQITGNFTQEEAQELAVLIEGGALPVPVEVIEQRVVGPTLGQAAIDASARAAVIGIVITGLFIVCVYRLMGLLATVALASYAVISYAALIAIGATLTLPGLAGFVLAVGMAIDANVLVFERAREEYDTGRAAGLRGALDNGFGKALTAIIDSNVTTLLAAGLLFFFASGPVRGFGVTLSIGVVVSMFSALVITRVLAEWAVRRRRVARHPAVTGIGSVGRIRDWLTRRDPDLIGRRRLWLGISAALVVVSLAGIGVRGLDLGVEFTGGRLVAYQTAEQVDVEEAREAVADAGFPRAVVQASGDDGVSVRDANLDNDDVVVIEEALSGVAGEVVRERDELIGPSLGDELRRNALIALGIALLAQMLYLAVRFRWTFGLSAVVAMLHDVLIVIGVFAWLGRPIDGVFLAAILTVIGVSVNDTVVVFDRVRELWRASPAADFVRTTNTAVLQTVPRTVNTGMGALFILVTLGVLGGDSLRDFALALVIGFTVGLLSSAFVASPIAAILQKRFPSDPTQPAEDVSPYASRSRRDPRDSGAVV